MIKAIFLDIGGVIILNRTSQVYEKWAQKLDIPLKDLKSKMRDFNNQRMKGEGEKPNFISEEQLIDFQNELWGTESVNSGLLDFIEKNKDKFTFGIITNNFKEAEEVILNKFKVPRFYKHFISSSDIGVLKPDPGIYEKAISESGFKPEECLFIDDSVENTNGAEEVGMVGLQFIDNDQFEREINEKA